MNLIKMPFMFIYSFLNMCPKYPIIETTNGPVKGKMVFDEGAEYYSYQGIPYAEPPTGALRFKPPVPRKSWTGTFDATKYGPVCPQPWNPYSPIEREHMSEDCLNLNIYVPVEQTEKLPVFIVVHASAYIFLSGREDLYGPQIFIKYGVILVTFNYRLGALGFLSIQTKEASGNAALKDVILAIKWIKANIERFGGDPNNITLGGNSSGSVMLHYLILSEQLKGLFERAMLLGGTALGFKVFSKYPRENARKLGARLGFGTNNLDALVQNLRQADAFDIIEAQHDDSDKRNGIRYGIPFVPVIEPESEHAIITKQPIELISKGAPSVPILVGMNTQEGMNMLACIDNDLIFIDYLNDDFELCIPSNIEYPYGSQESKRLAKTMKQLYLNNKNISDVTVQGYVDMISDLQFTYSTDSWIKIHKAANNSNRVFFYVFDFDDDLNWAKLALGINYDGAAHSDDMGYMFITRATKPLLKTASADSKKMIHVLMTLWSNFIKYGNPTPLRKLTTKVTVKWSDCGTERDYLLLNTRPTMVHGPPLQHRLNFWYNVYHDYEQYVQNGGILEPKIVP